MPLLTTRASTSLLRHLNAQRVLEALQQHGPMSRADLTRLTGVSGPTVTRTVADLLGANLLEEGAQQPTLGRPGKVLRLASTTVSVLGLVVGPQTCEAVSAGLDGVLHADRVRRFATPATYPELIDALAEHAAALAEGGPTVLGVGVSVPGLLNRRQGRTVVSPNLHQTDGRDLGADLSERLGLDVVVIQETHALCLAERSCGAARGAADFAMLDISGGLGLGVVHHGQLLEGHSGMAGELGHITVEMDGLPCGCGNRGCLETVATDASLAAAVSRRLGRTLTFDEVAAAAAVGQLDVSAELEKALHYLSVGVAAVINIFNPTKLFVYGRLLDVGTGTFERLMELVGRRALAPSLADCQVIRARGKKSQGAIAGILRRLLSGRAADGE